MCGFEDWERIFILPGVFSSKMESFVTNQFSQTDRNSSLTPGFKIGKNTADKTSWRDDPEIGAVFEKPEIMCYQKNKIIQVLTDA